MKLGRAWVDLPALCGFLLSFSFFLVGFVVLVICSCLYCFLVGFVVLVFCSCLYCSCLYSCLKLGRAWVDLPALCGFLLSFSFFFWRVLLYLFFVLACIFLSGGLGGGVCVSLYVSVCLCVCRCFHLNLALTSLSFRFLPLRYAVKGAFCHSVLSRLSVCIDTRGLVLKKTVFLRGRVR